MGFNLETVSYKKRNFTVWVGVCVYYYVVCVYVYYENLVSRELSITKLFSEYFIHSNCKLSKLFCVFEYYTY